MGKDLTLVLGALLLGLILWFMSLYLGQQYRLRQILGRAEDEYEDKIYKIAAMDLSLEATLGRLLRVTAVWLGLNRVRLILRYKTGEVKSSLLTSSGLQHNLSFASDDFAELTNLCQSQLHRRGVVGDRLKNDHDRRLLASYKIDYLLPLLSNGQILGFLALSDDKKLLDKYKLAEIWAASHGIVVALLTALRHDELIEINANLERRIKAATEELKNSNRQLAKLDQIKDDFIAMSSHQLRTPLTSVKGYLSLVLEGDAGALTPEQEQALGEAFRASETMARMINDFLNLSRLQTGRFNFYKKPADLSKILRQEFRIAEDLAKVYKRHLELKIEAKLPDQMLIDASKIAQAIANLLDNAIYYTKPDGQISVELKQGDDCLELMIKDDGIGVELGERSGIFQRFYRTSLAKKQRPGGSGIGLYIVKEIIEAHGGEVFYLPNQPRGSIFGFRLPIDKKLNTGIHIKRA